MAARSARAASPRPTGDNGERPGLGVDIVPIVTGRLDRW
jgi:hypothetical protein